MELWKSSKIQSRLYHIWLTLTPPGGGGRYSAQEQVDALLGTEVARCCLQVSTPNFERPYIICHQVSKDYEVFVRLIFSPFFYQVGIFFLTAQWWEEAKYIPEQKASKVGRNEINLTNQSNVALGCINFFLKAALVANSCFQKNPSFEALYKFCQNSNYTKFSLLKQTQAEKLSDVKLSELVVVQKHVYHPSLSPVFSLN